MTVGNQRSRVMGLERLNGRLLERDVNIDVSSADGVRCIVLSDDDEADDDNAHIIMPTKRSTAALEGARILVGRWIAHTSLVALECLSIPEKRVRAAGTGRAWIFN